MKDLFKIKTQPYFLRDQILLVQPYTRTTTHGLRSFSYLGSKLWNTLPEEFKRTPISEIDVSLFKKWLQEWSFPDHDTFLNPLL